MPIGKDSITKRVAKQPTEEKIAPELVATTAAAPAAKKAPAKKTSSSSSTTKKTTSTAKKTTSTTKKATPKKDTPKEAPAAPATVLADAPVVETAVLTNVSPETVAAVIGHKEDEKYAKVQLGQKLPDFLL
jgi:hypothetical protein